MIKTFTLSTALLLLSYSKYQSQNTIDSLAGFDESAAIRASIGEDFRGAELRVHLSQLKRNYIVQKFGIKPVPLVSTNFSNKIVVAACVNEDFEASTAATVTSSTQITGWTITRGNNMNGNNNCNLSGCCSSSPMEAILISAANGYTDPVIGSIYPIYSVFGSAASNTNAALVNPQITAAMGGNNFIRINAATPGDYSVERISKTFSVTGLNAMFSFAFISVQSAGHSCCDAGGFIIRITNVTTNSLLSTVSYSASGLSASCISTTGVTYLNAVTGTTANSSSSLLFNKWHVNYIDLSPYMTQNIQVEVIAGDCTAGGHYAYSYFDAQCGPVDITVNGLNKNSSCASTATISAPANLNSYQWSGPGGFTSTASTFTTTTAGVYSLTIPQNPPYQAIQKTLSLVISPASVTLSASKLSVCSGEKVVLTASGLATYSWSSGGSAPSVTINPTTTKTYTLTGNNSDNCAGFALITVSVNACTGINELDENAEVVVFPNPNNGEFSITLPKSVQKAELSISNQLGQIVHNQSVQGGDNKIKTKGLANGMYYYYISEQNGVRYNGRIRVQ